jgi:hypothetical protein
MMTGSSSAAWTGAASTTPATAQQAKSNNGAAPAPATVGQKVLRGATVAIAIAIGATGGTFSALGFLQYAQLTQLTEAAPMPTMVDETRAMWSTVMQLQNEIAVLKATIESDAAHTITEFLKTDARIDRLDRSQSDYRRNDVTASVPPAPPQAATQRTSAVAGWSVRDAYGNTAIIQGARQGTKEVSPGDNIPGLGRIHSIKQQQDGRWVVVTSRGIITSPR